jgi:hypothetical protein
MGFALWIDGDVAIAQGTHEYRPMGAAAISSATVFTPRDFDRRRRAPRREDPRFAGFFASLGEVNDYLAGVREGRRSQWIEKKRAARKSGSIPYF